MRIDSIHIYRLPLELRPPDGLVDVPRESILVRLQSGPHSAWGEACLATEPVECGQWSRGAFSCLRDILAPAVIGREIDSGAALQESLDRWIDNQAAKSALDLAWWQLAAAARGAPLHQLLGAQRETVVVSRALGVPVTMDALVDEIKAALAEGHGLVTLKFRPGWDLEMLRAVRQEFAAAPLEIDCDGLCSLAQQEMFYRLEDFFLQSIEQPLPAEDLVGHAMLQQNLRTPLALDQSVTSPARVEQALDLGSCRLLRIDPARVGGLTPALAIHDLCRAAQVPCAVGGGPNAGVAAAAAVALAARCEGLLPDQALLRGSASCCAAIPRLAPEKNSRGNLEIRLTTAASGPPTLDEQAVAAAALEHAALP